MSEHDPYGTMHATTIITVRKDGKVVMAGDGQVSLGQTVMKGNARKVRRLGKGDVIGLYGVHMMGRSEFTWQRACVTWLIGLAEGRGVEVYIPPGSPLFMSGYEAGRYGPYCRERNVNAITGA